MIVLTLAATASMLATQYLQTAKQFKEALAMTYLSESALLVTWTDWQQQSWQDIPQKGRWDFQDKIGFTEKGQQIQLNCTTGVSGILPVKGALRATACYEPGYLQRSCAIRFEITLSEETGEIQYIVREILY
ncbi:MAG: hypothetical protein LKF47_04585 [Megasphaera sp.]|nr:hypothetical protein [Megasphaera sp.]MCI1248118.1 hypothetical protein [Megasphaera sp.]